jgi:glutamate--cysteine ligase catalytic subunit
MGLLVLGHPIEWEDSKKNHQYVKKLGVEQFLQLYQKYAGSTDAPFKWGDEVEYYIRSMDDASKVARLPLRAPEILEKLAEMQQGTNSSSSQIIWHPEYANWMLEATPGQPYSESIEGLIDVEANMVLRRKHISALLQPGEHLFSMICFPRMGTPGFTSPALPLKTTADGVAQSI